MTKQTRNIIKWNLDDQATASRRNPRGEVGFASADHQNMKNGA